MAERVLLEAAIPSPFWVISTKVSGFANLKQASITLHGRLVICPWLCMVLFYSANAEGLRKIWT